MCRCIFALALCLPFVAIAQSLQETQTIARALKSLDDANQDDAWLFTLTLVENEEERVIRHDPRREPYKQRTLVSVDGVAPGRKHLKEFHAQEKQRVEDRDPEANYSFLVDLDTLESADGAAGISQYTFSPRIKRLDGARDHLRGKLAVNVSTGAIERIEVFNTTAFSPAFSVKLEQYQLIFSFRDEQGARLLDNMHSRAVGKAGFLKKFDSKVDVGFSHYQRASDNPRQASD